MPYEMQLENPEAIYHVMSRGDRREALFHDGISRQDFLKTLVETCLKTGVQMHANCLMGNHLRETRTSFSVSDFEIQMRE